VSVRAARRMVTVSCTACPDWTRRYVDGDFDCALATDVSFDAHEAEAHPNGGAGYSTTTERREAQT